MKFLLPFVLLLIYFVFPAPISAQVVINEVSPSGEWVELYNSSLSETSLEGCVLTMGSASQDVNYTASDLIQGAGYVVAEKEVTAEWTANWLNNDGDSVLLDCPSVGDDSISYGSEIDTKTYGRSPNGTGGFVILESETKGLANSGVQPTPSPTPQPTQSATPAPTSAPTTTPTPTKTPTPIPTKTPTPKPTKSPTPQASESPEVLGLTFGESPTPTAMVEGDIEKKKSPILPIVFIGSGVLMIGFAVYNLVRAKKNPVQS